MIIMTIVHQGFSFGLMSTAKESENMSNLDHHMALSQLEQDYSSAFLPPSELTSLPGTTNSGQGNAVGPFLKPVLPNCIMSYITGNPYLKDSKNSLIHDIRATNEPVDSFCAPQRKFFIFDKSGNQTRVFFSPLFSPHNNPILASDTPSSAKGPFDKKTKAREYPEFLIKPTMIEEKWDENNLSDGEREDDMVEDSDEIDALLYSDSDYDDDYDVHDNDDDDEVTSTGHSPITIEDGYHKDKSLEEPFEEVMTSDCMQKRFKLFDGEYKNSSCHISCGYEDDDDDDINSSKREKKVKLRQALKILESIIPSLNTKDPLSIIDNAIVYLRSMKAEAEVEALSHPGDKSVIFP